MTIFVFCLALNTKNELPATGKAWNEQNRVTPAAAGNSVNKLQPTTANTVASVSANKSALANTNAVVKNTSSAKNKQKKEDPASKKTTSLTLAIPKNDELSKWGVKALSNLKPSVDGKYVTDTFIQYQSHERYDFWSERFTGDRFMKLRFLSGHSRWLADMI